MNINCNLCSAQISVDDIGSRVVGEFKGEEVTLDYLQCRRCGQEYPSIYITERFQRRLKQQEKLRLEIEKLVKWGEAAKAEQKQKKWLKEYAALIAYQEKIKGGVASAGV
jgi:hypothetical protein